MANNTILYGSTNTYSLDGSQVEGVKVTIPFPKKSAIVRHPNSEETLNFFKDDKKKRTREEKAEEFFKLIRLDQSGEAFDEYEAVAVVDTFTKSSVGGLERIGDDYAITVTTPFGDTTHTLSIPTQKQLALFRRNAYQNYVTGVSTFYDQLLKSTEGYVDGFKVPVYHKLDAVSAIMNAIDAIDPIVSLDPNE